MNNDAVLRMYRSKFTWFFGAVASPFRTVWYHRKDANSAASWQRRGNENGSGTFS